MKSQGLNYSLFFILTLSLFNCTKKNIYKFSDVKYQHIPNFLPGFKDYCALDLNSSFELNAVQCSFYGDYQSALNQATKRQTIANNPSDNISIGHQNTTKAHMIETFEAKLKDPLTSEEAKASVQEIINIIKTPNAEEIFAEAKPVPAIDYIIENAKDYHYTLINEAHYNSQHRSFTKDLLLPLWKEGYRYLALETLSYQDPSLQERGYPISSTGYYTQDSNFGNLVREALQIGYKLISYETQNHRDGTLRDTDQANNIYEQTLKKDQKGKVLIHAGYSHIKETGDSYYEPMGYQLKKLTNQDILTVDQVQMVGLNDPLKLHPYYREATSKYQLSEPTVFLNNKEIIIIDPIQKLGIDIQMYHPMTRFEQGRPHWIKSERIKQIPLTPEIAAFKGCLIQAVLHNEEKEAIPVDQFVIADEKALLLPLGNYELRIVNCEGKLIGTSKLEVN